MRRTARRSWGSRLRDLAAAILIVLVVALNFLSTLLMTAVSVIDPEDDRGECSPDRLEKPGLPTDRS